MKEEVMDQLLPLVEKFKESVLSGIDIAQVQVPIVLEQLLKWKFVESILACVLFGVGIVVFTMALKKAFEANEKDDENRTVVRCVTSVVVGVTLLFCGIGGLVTGTFIRWLQILVAPKLYLLEYATQLLKQG